MVGGTGLVGLEAGIAFRGIAEDFLASVFLRMQRPFETGDLVGIIGVTGHVQQFQCPHDDPDGAGRQPCADSERYHLQEQSAQLHEQCQPARGLRRWHRPRGADCRQLLVARVRQSSPDGRAAMGSRCRATTIAILRTTGVAATAALTKARPHTVERPCRGASVLAKRTPCPSPRPGVTLPRATTGESPKASRMGQFDLDNGVSPALPAVSIARMLRSFAFRRNSFSMPTLIRILCPAGMPSSS